MFDPRRTTSSDDRFIELALCYLDGRSSAEQLSQLNTELAADGFKRELFVDTCLHGKLLSELLGNSTANAHPG